MKLDEYMMIKEAAAYVGVTPNTLRNWEKHGKLKTIRNPINKYRLYLKADLDQLLNSIKVQK